VVLGVVQFSAIGIEGSNRAPEVHPSEGCGASIEEGEDDVQIVDCGRADLGHRWVSHVGFQG
jgi:hypothetical protein